MADITGAGDVVGHRYTSTGDLPGRGTIGEILRATHARYAPVTEGRVSTVYPALGRADPRHFGLGLVGVSGAVQEVATPGSGSRS